MDLVLIFAVTLVIAVLVSDFAHRSIVSVAVLFLLSGFLFEEEVLGLIRVDPSDASIRWLSELALFAVLFTDGMRSAFDELRSAWRLPGRALLLGMPLTLALFALLAHQVVGLPWSEALLVAAILSPTDPVFAAAVVGREAVPARLRHLLNVESGLNDGLALPAVLALLAVVSAGEPHLAKLLGEVAGGVALGVAVPWIVLRLESTRFFASRPRYDPLNAFAIGLVVLATSKATGMNEFLAAFAAGVTVTTVAPEIRRSFAEFGELVAELLKLAALLLFGALISPAFLAGTPWTHWAFALLALIAVRPAALGIALVGSRLPRKERLAAMWFGPRGFASVVYALMLFHRELAPETRDPLFHLVALVVVLSMLAHSSTDVLVARGFGREDAALTEDGPAPVERAR